MLHENVKFFFKVIYPTEAHYITRQIFPVFVQPHNPGRSWFSCVWLLLRSSGDFRIKKVGKPLRGQEKK